MAQLLNDHDEQGLHVDGISKAVGIEGASQVGRRLSAPSYRLMCNCLPFLRDLRESAE